jgi:hypothetical protein
MHIYIIGDDGITLCHEPPAAVNQGEIAVVSSAELHAARLSGKRLLALWNAVPGVEKRRKLGDRDALIDQLWSAIELLPGPEPQSDPKRPSKQDAVIAMLRRPEGATVDEVASATGWQRHTVRGVFSGTLKKKLGFTLASAKEGSGAGSTASPSRRGCETPSPRRFGSPALWRAVLRSRSKRGPEQLTAKPGHCRSRSRNCGIGRSVDKGAAACLADIASFWTASGPQSGSDHPGARR